MTFSIFMMRRFLTDSYTKGFSASNLIKMLLELRDYHVLFMQIAINVKMSLTPLVITGIISYNKLSNIDD